MSIFLQSNISARADENYLVFWQQGFATTPRIENRLDSVSIG